MILSGIDMPGMDGLELLREIKQWRPDDHDEPLIWVTSGTGGTGEYGAAEFVTKPADFEILSPQLRQLSTAAD